MKLRCFAVDEGNFNRLNYDYLNLIPSRLHSFWVFGAFLAKREGLSAVKFIEVRVAA